MTHDIFVIVTFVNSPTCTSISGYASPQPLPCGIDGTQDIFNKLQLAICNKALTHFTIFDRKKIDFKGAPLVASEISLTNSLIDQAVVQLQIVANK